MSHNNMKGLARFITDLRNAKERELETKRVNHELANIRNKFQDPSLNGYQKKKYICKLIYIYILGYEINFGHWEAITLTSSANYSEKQVGYLAVSILLNEHSEMLPLAINSIKKDLNNMNEYFTCLALNCIATIGGTTVSDALADDIFKLLISPTSQDFVKKKAALTILRLYRKDPKIIDPLRADRILALIDSPNLGVAISVASLANELVQDNPEQYKLAYSIVVRRLQNLLFERGCPEDYIYYSVPVPWLFVKLLRLLQYFPPSQDETICMSLRKVLVEIIEVNSTPARNTQQANAQNAVLFEAINLAVHVDIDSDLMERIVQILGSFLTSKETNIRYLALKSMTTLASGYDQVPLSNYLINIIQSLRDHDISIRRKAIDLLYSICNANNVRTIVNELLKYLQTADFTIRGEMAIRIAVLVEKYATEYQWYVDISLKLLSIAGSHINEDVWQRIVQIVVNNENIQSYSVKTVLSYLRSSQCNENLIKVGGYLLGEYGHLITEEPRSSPLDQFLALHDRFPNCTSFTKRMLLTTYIKFVHLYPEIRSDLLKVFDHYATSTDSELQQRAVEYLNMAKPENIHLLTTIWDEIPPFPERSSTMLMRLKSKKVVSGSENKRVWNTGRRKKGGDSAVPLVPLLPINLTGAATPAGNTSNNDVLTLLQPKSTGRPAPPASRKGSVSIRSTSGSSSMDILTSGWTINYKKLLLNREGILYEDSVIQIGFRSDYRRQLGCVILYFRNVSGSSLSSLSVELLNPPSQQHLLYTTTKNFPESFLAPNATTQQVILMTVKGAFPESPKVRITYMAGTLQVLVLKLPVILEKFMDKAELSAEDYFKKWNQIGAASPGELESQKVFKIRVNPAATGISSLNSALKTSADDLRIMDKALNWSSIANADKNVNNIVGAGILHTALATASTEEQLGTNGETSNFGALIRLEPNEDRSMYRVTVRATDADVARVMADNVAMMYQL